MARQNLSSMTDEERKAYKREQANERKRRQRRLARDKRQQDRTAAIFTEESPEVIEFVDALKGLPFSAIVEALAFWQRENKQMFPSLHAIRKEGEETLEFEERSKHFKYITLATMLSCNFYAQQKANERKRRFNKRQELFARGLGISVSELQQRKRQAAWRKEREEEYAAAKERVLLRLAQKRC